MVMMMMHPNNSYYHSHPRTHHREASTPYDYRPYHPHHYPSHPPSQRSTSPATTMKENNDHSTKKSSTSNNNKSRGVIQTITDHDVLLLKSTDARIRTHTGNRRLRALIRRHAAVETKQDNFHAVVDRVLDVTLKHGRFLRQVESSSSSKWQECSTSTARAYIGRALQQQQQYNRKQQKNQEHSDDNNDEQRKESRRERDDSSSSLTPLSLDASSLRQTQRFLSEPQSVQILKQLLASSTLS